MVSTQGYGQTILTYNTAAAYRNWRFRIHCKRAAAKYGMRFLCINVCLHRQQQLLSWVSTICTQTARNCNSLYLTARSAVSAPLKRRHSDRRYPYRVTNIRSVGETILYTTHNLRDNLIHYTQPRETILYTTLNLERQSYTLHTT
jgi:hypothetical protein